MGQAFVPPAFEFGDDESVGWVNGIELALGARSLEARLLKGQFQLTSLGLIVIGALLDGMQRGLYANGLQCGKDFPRNGLVHP